MPLGTKLTILITAQKKRKNESLTIGGKKTWKSWCRLERLHQSAKKKRTLKEKGEEKTFAERGSLLMDKEGEEIVCLYLKNERKVRCREKDGFFTAKEG